MRPYRASSTHKSSIRSFRRKDENEKNSSSSTDSNSNDSKPVVDDYMSMDFILKAQSHDITNSNNRTKPRRTVNNQSRKRKFRDDDYRKNQFLPQQKKVKVRMEEAREQGLSTPIPSSNIGHKLLSKMGYKEGMTIGKQVKTEKESKFRQNGTESNSNSNQSIHRIALKEPIAIKIRDNKSGLGVIERKEQRVDALLRRIESQKANRDKIFKLSVREKMKRVQCIRDIKQCRIICHNLDTKDDENKENPLWSMPLEMEKKWNEEYPECEWNEFENVLVAECEQILFDLVVYLRNEYQYCYWCGVQYESVEERKLQCPGNEKNQHDSLTDF